PAFLLLFLPVFVTAYLLGTYRLRIASGIIGSVLFYAWGDLRHLPVILGLLLGTYGLSRLIDSRGDRHSATWLVGAGIVANVGSMVAYRLVISGSYPLGLSYLAFQSIAHLIEVKRTGMQDDRNLARFSFYLLLFPKILAGPITRYSQLRKEIGILRPEPEQLADGLRRFIGGVAKKALLADTLERLVTPIFQLPSPTIPFSWAWLVLLAYAVQLFMDFSGYTDMAIGLGRMLGVTFPENFNYPYAARSVADFWRRWHISLANWFRDFVFFPLERRRLPYIGQPLNLILVFLLVGLWHGLTRNFAIWGLIHGVAIAFESTPLGRRFTRLPAGLGNFYTLSVVLLGWVFFRSPTPDFALDYLRRLAGDKTGLSSLPFELTRPLPLIEPTIIAAIVIGLWLSLPAAGRARAHLSAWFETRGMGIPFRLLSDVALIGVLIISIAAIASYSYAPGIYARF
ncbi:MAG TPA: MBOAT family O-acyltransferase, partial [Anaerolineales bacterium]